MMGVASWPMPSAPSREQTASVQNRPMALRITLAAIRRTIP